MLSFPPAFQYRYLFHQQELIILPVNSEVGFSLFLLVMVAFALEKWNEIARLLMEQPSS